MSQSGDPKMRRQFNQALLPVSIPEKYEQQAPRRNKYNYRSAETSDLMRKLIYESRDLYNTKDLAAACLVTVGTVRHWRYGRQIGKLSQPLLARYFAPLVRRPYPDLIRELEAAYTAATERR